MFVNIFEWSVIWPGKQGPLMIREMEKNESKKSSKK